MDGHTDDELRRQSCYPPCVPRMLGLSLTGDRALPGSQLLGLGALGNRLMDGPQSPCTPTLLASSSCLRELLDSSAVFCKS